MKGEDRNLIDSRSAETSWWSDRVEVLLSKITLQNPTNSTCNHGTHSLLRGPSTFLIACTQKQQQREITHSILQFRKIQGSGTGNRKTDFPRTLKPKMVIATMTATIFSPSILWDHPSHRWPLLTAPEDAIQLLYIHLHDTSECGILYMFSSPRTSSDLHHPLTLWTAHLVKNSLGMRTQQQYARRNASSC